jgi:GH25 family lysozyme M1 (1,4-beta-N-acetylmuramidase)
MIHGIDVSSWQNPAKFDWPALAKSGKFLIARASYGKKPDKTFTRYAALCREHGVVFGAYLFYRQTQTVTDQFAVWNRQLDAIGELLEGDVFPVLDMEENKRNGDGRPNPAVRSSTTRAISQTASARRRRTRTWSGCASRATSTGSPTTLARPV